MTNKNEQFSAKNQNPMLCVEKDGTIIYSNKAGEPLLHEWVVGVGEKLPLSIRELVQDVISLSNPDKIEVKVGKKVYLIVLNPLPDEEHVNISGFDISDQKELEEKVQENDAREIANVELAEIFDVNVIKPLMDDFYKLTHIPIGLNDLNGNILVGAGWQEICTKFHMAHPEACKQCIESTTKFTVSVLTGEFILYKCKNNMWHIVTPIMAGSHHVGNIFAGQFFFDDEHLDYELFRSQARKYGFNEEEYITALEKAPRLSREAVDTGMSFFMAFANMLSHLSYSNIKLVKSLSERDTLLEELRKSEGKYRNIVETANEGIITVDSEARTTYANEKMADMLGYSQEEIFGKSIFEFVDEEGKSILKQNLDQRKQGIHQVYELGLIRKDRSSLCTLVSAKFNIDGKFIGSLGMVTDITERKKAEAKLKETHENLEKIVQERTSELEKAYDSLKESERGLAEAQKMAHIGNWEWDIAADKAYWSDELYRIFKRSPKEPAPNYNEYLNYTHPEDRDYFDNAVKKAINGKPYSIDQRIVLANGEECTVHIQSKVVFNKENIPIRIKGIVQDITERKKAEEKIRTLANAVESSNDAILTESLEGIVTSWNKGAEQVYGYSAEEILGKNISIVEPENLKGEIKRFSEKIMQGKKIQRYETLRQKKDGTIINVSVTLSPIFDASGKLMAISAITRDITEQKRAEETIRESEARLRRFYESGIFGMLYYNLDGSITDANDEFLEIVGYTREDLQAGRINWAKMTPPEYRPLDEHATVELKATGVTTPFEKEYIRKDGSHVPIILGVATFDQASNEGIAFVLDITERKKAEEALARSEKARKKEIHHRIKNNLQVISSLLDLQADKFKDKEVLEAFKESKNRVLSMSLIHEELYKGEDTDTLDFSAYLQKLAKDLFQTYDLGGKNIRLCMNLEENAFFNMDIAIPLGIIVNELISNSLKHAFIGRDSGEIRIKLCRGENGEIKGEGCKRKNLILMVSDDGIGLPESFDFEYLDTLGFQLITTLIEQLDGELELKRDNGTTFIIRFTVTEKNNQTSAPLI